MEELYNHVFHYNPYEKLWNAIPRDVYLEYWSNRNVEGVLKSKDINTLIEILSKGEDFVKSHFK